MMTPYVDARMNSMREITEPRFQPGSGPNAGIDQLQARLDRATLLLQSLLMILMEKKVIHEDELREWVRYVDEFDGSVDGRLKEDKSPVACPKCSRKNPRTAATCQYCGVALEQDILFRRPEPAPGDPTGA